MNFCGIQINPAEQAAIASFALMAASELIGMSKLRENSLIQLVLGLLKGRINQSSRPSPTPRTSDPVSPSSAKKSPGRPRGSTSSRSSRAKA